MSALFCAINANAEVLIEHSANVAAETEYNSNIQFLDRGAESAFIYSLIPRYQIKALDGVNTWSGLVGATLARSSNSTVFGNREDPFGRVGWSRVLENGTVGINAGYLRESARVTQLLQTGLVAEDATSVTRDVRANWSRNLGQRLNLKMQAGYEKSDFNQTARLDAFSIANIDAELAYKLDARYTPFIQLAATDYKSSSRMKWQDVIIGTSVFLSPQLKMKGGAGVTHISTFDGEVSDVQPIFNNNEAIGFLQLDYTGERSLIKLALLREVFGTAINTVELGDRMNLDYQYALSETSRLGGALILSQNRSNQDNQDVIGFYERDFTDSWLMRLSMGLSNIKSEGQNSTDNKTVGVMFTYNSPNF